MRIILLGPPGAGKGSQAERISAKFGIPHISTGNMMREFRRKETEMGFILDAYMSKGLLVPDNITLQIVEERLEEQDCEKGFLLDGFPRTIPQAEAFEEDYPGTTVINLCVNLDCAAKRIAGRRTCAECGATYHTDMLGGKTRCSKCNGALVQRSDETDEAVSKRLQVYVEQTKPLIGFYEARDVLKNVNGDQSIDEVFQDIVKIIGER